MTDITPQLLETFHSQVTVPNLLILYITFSIFFLISGFILIDKKRGEHPYRKFMWIWFTAVLLSGIILAFLIASPNLVNNFVEWVKILWF